MIVLSGFNSRTSSVIISLTFIDIPPRLQPVGDVPAAARPQKSAFAAAVPMTV
jgi:hypothetical protein